MDNFIRHRREELGMTQGELASKTGLTQGAISRYESGEIKDISYKNMSLLANALDVSLTDLDDWLRYERLREYEQEELRRVFGDGGVRMGEVNTHGGKAKVKNINKSIPPAAPPPQAVKLDEYEQSLLDMYRGLGIFDRLDLLRLVKDFCTQKKAGQSGNNNNQ